MHHSVKYISGSNVHSFWQDATLAALLIIQIFLQLIELRQNLGCANKTCNKRKAQKKVTDNTSHLEKELDNVSTWNKQ